MKEYEILVGDIESGTGVGRLKTQIEVQSPSILTKLPEEGKEVTVGLRDPSTMGSFLARVIFFSDPARIPEGDRVFFVEQATRRHLTEQPWAVKIVETLEEADEDVEALPTRKLSLGERKGTLLKDMLAIRDKKAKEKQK